MKVPMDFEREEMETKQDNYNNQEHVMMKEQLYQFHWCAGRGKSACDREVRAASMIIIVWFGQNNQETLPLSTRAALLNGY